MLASLLGAVIGGVFTLLGGWFAIRWQTMRSARAVAGALLAEIRTAETMLAKGGVGNLYEGILDHWKETGRVEDRQTIADIFDNDPRETLPVYYAMAPQLGLLPHDLSAAVIEYHAKVIGLNKMIVRLMGKRELNEASVKALALSIEAQWNEQQELRRNLIAMLAKPCKVGAGRAVADS